MIKQIRLCGFGGQGIILAGSMLGYAGIKDRKWASEASSYGGEARGGACRADVIIADHWIVFPRVLEADFLVSMSQLSYEKYIGMIKRKTGFVIYDAQLVNQKEMDDVKQMAIPAMDVAMKEFQTSMPANTIMLGAMIQISNVVSKEALFAAIKELAPRRFLEMNLKAAEVGFKLARGL